jgi:hypothetical protein
LPKRLSIQLIAFLQLHFRTPLSHDSLPSTPLPHSTFALAGVSRRSRCREMDISGFRTPLAVSSRTRGEDTDSVNKGTTSSRVTNSSKGAINHRL